MLSSNVISASPLVTFSSFKSFSTGIFHLHVVLHNVEDSCHCTHLLSKYHSLHLGKNNWIEIVARDFPLGDCLPDRWQFCWNCPSPKQIWVYRNHVVIIGRGGHSRINYLLQQRLRNIIIIIWVTRRLTDIGLPSSWNDFVESESNDEMIFSPSSS